VTALAPLTLAISTASPALSLALFRDAALVAHDHRLIGRGHAEALMPAIAALMGNDRADAVLVDIGPGSFTGIRIGIAAARALGVAWAAPVNGFSGASLIAAAAFARQPALDAVDAIIDAGRGQSFVQRISQDFSADDVQTLPSADLRAGAVPMAGDVAEDIAAAWRGQPDCAFALQIPDTVRLLAATARYVRPPDAILPL
jgi:tRNA threonylcarbamoyl adenosine modification protein YeaZ